jgi:crossover junction endodeoxyribonuclease RusA
VTAGRQWTLEWEVRPLPENELRKLHWAKRASYTESWRDTFGWLARRARVPQLAGAVVTVAQSCRPGTTLPDVGAVFNTAKAAIDGLVDVGVIPDDDPAHLHALVFVAPQHGPTDRFVVIVEESIREAVA